MTETRIKSHQLLGEEKGTLKLNIDVKHQKLLISVERGEYTEDELLEEIKRAKAADTLSGCVEALVEDISEISMVTLKYLLEGNVYSLAEEFAENILPSDAYDFDVLKTIAENLLYDLIAYVENSNELSDLVYKNLL